MKGVKLPRYPPQSIYKLIACLEIPPPRQAINESQTKSLVQHLPTHYLHYMATSLPSQTEPSSDLYSKIVEDVFKENLRQVKITFNLSIFAVSTSIIVSIIGAGLIVSGNANQGSVTAASGLISATCCSQIAKQSSEKLKGLSVFANRLKASS